MPAEAPPELKSTALAIMARAPVLHESKSRLAVALGPAGALQAHCDLVEATLTRLHGLASVEVSLWVTQKNHATETWAAAYGLPLFVQRGRDLGAKMHYTLNELLNGSVHSACLVGTDCPTIDADYVTQAFAQLQHTPVVVGPAEDGGYGLIGMTEACADLFQQVQWGSRRVLTQTLRQAAAHGLEVAQLATIWDVDEPADWRRYQRWRTAGG